MHLNDKTDLHIIHLVYGYFFSETRASESFWADEHLQALSTSASSLSLSAAATN